MKIRNLFLLVCIAGCFAACSKNEVKEDDYDKAGQYKIDSVLIDKFVKDNKIVGTLDKSGIFYQIIEPGTGMVQYNDNSRVTAFYKGSLLNGTVFDETKGEPFTFALNGVIDGWRIGIPFIQKGGKIRLIIPSGLGYKNRATGPIPPNSVLDFTVVLTNVVQ